MNELINRVVLRKHVTVTRIIERAYEYAEKPISQKSIHNLTVLVIKHHKITKTVEDFCIDVLAGRITIGGIR